MRHKHADVLIAIAEGKEVQFKDKDDDIWFDSKNYPSVTPLTHSHLKWRIKKEPKHDVIMYGVACYVNGNYLVSGMSSTKIHYDNLKLIFDGETEKLKSAEVLK